MKRAVIRLAGAVALCLSSLAAPAAAGEGRLAPIPDEASTSRHAPYEMGQCDACHEASGPSRRPGRVVKGGNALCFDCHDEFKKAVKGHPATANGACVGCHSPHNSTKKKLLL